VVIAEVNPVEILDRSLRNRQIEPDDADILLKAGLIRPDSTGYCPTQSGNESLKKYNPGHYKSVYINHKVKGSHVVFSDNLFVWTGGYKTKELPKSAGFRWDATKRRWWTDRADIARKLFDFADYDARAEMGSPVIPEGLDDYKSLVLQCLKYLASVCDYAKTLDYQGYSKSDTSIGHTLAAKNSLTAEQAALGLPLIRVHQCQLPEWMVSLLKPFIDAVADEGVSRG
jgi:hypothetical protein